MDTLFYNRYYKYFLWNKGLIDYFFRKGKREILLYIDKQLLEEIGKSNGIEAEDYYKDFVSCVENFCNHYNSYICIKQNPNEDNVCRYSDCKYYSNIFCLKKNMRSDVLAVANHIYSKNIKYFDKYESYDGSIKIRESKDKKPIVHDIPFFAIVIYVILKFDNGETQKWNNVGSGIKLKSREYIPNLWEEIYNFDKRFDKDASYREKYNIEKGDYVGRIKYHLPLSAPTRNRIKDAIYKSSAWKLIDSKSFFDIIGFIANSLKDIDANVELRTILSDCCSSDDYKGISARKVQSVIDDFDVDAYESKMTERKQTTDYNETIVSGEFALGIYFPNNEQTENSIVLLTTVQQNVNDGGFYISEGKSGTLAGYNISFVELLDKSKKIELKDYSLKNRCYNIIPLKTDNVIFFYEYDDCLFIQTRDIKPAKSYIIAVHNEKKSVFKEWCNNNDNTLEQWPNEDTKDLFGEKWTIFYTDKKLNGQYYQNESAKLERQELSTIVMKGGIKKSNGCYFINALPYFEIPTIDNPDNIKVFMNLNGVNIEDFYNYRVVDNKIIIDIKEMPIESSEIAYVDICLEYNNKANYYSINVCGQNVAYNPSNSYKFDDFGIIADTETDSFSYSGNHIIEKYQSKNNLGLFQIGNEDFCSIQDDLYFTNLLAACCYDSECFEITHAKLRKCISYAASRLNIDIQKEGFISNTKRILSNAGLLHIDYSTGKCQAIAPSFMRVPFSEIQSQGSQLWMLGGCYTRSFIADLIKYCSEQNVRMHSIRNKTQRYEEKLLPPIILIGHNFSPSNFCGKYGQQCDVLDKQDFALSLLNMIPLYKEICSKFQFKQNDSYQFLPRLESATTDAIPRIRSMIGIGTHKEWYLERANNEFAKIEQGLLPWASIFCHHEMSTPMVIKQRDNSVYIPVTLMLPNYVERALYLMNPGFPETKKVFVCGYSCKTYYILMNRYKLHNQIRCDVFVSKISGSDKDNSLVRDVVRTTFGMELYKSRLNGSKYQNIYMVLKDNNGSDILAVAQNHNVYLNHQGRFYRLDANTVNEAMTFLIKGGWQFAEGGKSIGYSRNNGLIFEPVFDLTNEEIKLPDLSRFNKEEIQII